MDLGGMCLPCLLLSRTASAYFYSRTLAFCTCRAV